MFLVLSAFLLASGIMFHDACGQELWQLPRPGTRIGLSPAFAPPLLKGIKIYPNNPFRFDFILDQGDLPETGEQLKIVSSRLIKYFLAALTVPENDLWVNLSPYEKDRIVPDAFGQTEMGRDLLVQDYLLKQITASLIYPEDETGRKFWKKVYAKAFEKFGTIDIPIDTFNKVWIMPAKAEVYENTRAGTAYVVGSRLKVMLESDYLAIKNNPGGVFSDPNHGAAQVLVKDVVREIVLPELEREVNEGKSFVTLRQVYQSFILAAWYKKRIKDSILTQIFVDHNKVAGVNIEDPDVKERIYKQYFQGFMKGVYNYIKEEKNPVTQEMFPRKYFSGGVGFTDKQMIIKEKFEPAISAVSFDNAQMIQVLLDPLGQGMSLTASGAPDITATRDIANSGQHGIDFSMLSLEDDLDVNSILTRRAEITVMIRKYLISMFSKESDAKINFEIFNSEDWFNYRAATWFYRFLPIQNRVYNFERDWSNFENNFDQYFDAFIDQLKDIEELAGGDIDEKRVFSLELFTKTARIWGMISFLEESVRFFLGQNTSFDIVTSSVEELKMTGYVADQRLWQMLSKTPVKHYRKLLEARRVFINELRGRMVKNPAKIYELMPGIHNEYGVDELLDYLLGIDIKGEGYFNKSNYMNEQYSYMGTPYYILTPV